MKAGNHMNDKKSLLLHLAILLICICLTAGIAYKAGTDKGAAQADEEISLIAKERDELIADRDLLQELNRSSIANMVLVDGPIHVIGHKSPDSDTVCTAIAFAKLLNELGYEAKPVITMPVNHETAYILKEAGVETPEILYDASGLNIFLVDHSEYAQSAEGMIDANIVGVLDHHGIGTVSTGHQVIYDARPIGATATIAWLKYRDYGVEIDKQTAHVLLGAILSDTGYLTGSTTTDADRAAVPYLAKIAGVEDVDAFYARLHEESLSYEGMSEEEILFCDYKEYEASGVKFGINTLNAIDDETAKALAERMKTALAEYGPTRDVDLIYCVVGMRENGLKHDYVVCGNERSESILKNAFPDHQFDGTSYLYDKGIGRKTVFVPGLTDYLAAHPHE